MTDYNELNLKMSGLAEDQDWWVTLLSNASALLYDTMEDLNWAGFYLVQDEMLKLGPFQGKVACTQIAFGRGVCGTAWAMDQTLRVEDVHAFPGHIACDSASNSEIVIPIHKDDAIWGVLDIDSPRLARFSTEDQKGLEAFVRILEGALESV